MVIAKRVAIFVALACAFGAIMATLDQSLPDPWADWTFVLIVPLGALIRALGRRWAGWPTASTLRELPLPIVGATPGPWEVRLDHRPAERARVVRYLSERHRIDAVRTNALLKDDAFPILLAEAMSNGEAAEITRDLREFGASVTMRRGE